jgi:hypothetical protein
MGVMIIMHDVNNREVEVGPYSQVCQEFDAETGAVVIKGLREGSTDPEAVVYGAGWWYHEGIPYKQMWVRDDIQEERVV